MVPVVPPLPPRVAPLVEVVPLLDPDGPGTRDWRLDAGVWYLCDGLEDVGGFSTNDVSVVLCRVRFRANGKPLVDTHMKVISLSGSAVLSGSLKAPATCVNDSP